MAVVMVAVAATVLAVAVNVATGGTSPWLPSVEAHPLWWSAGATAAGALSALMVWWSQRLADRLLAELIPAEQRPEAWVVDRPTQVGQIAAALCQRNATTVGITTALQGAGGFGKTTVAKLVRADRRVLRRFGGRIYWVTLGRDVRTPAAIVEKVNNLISRLDTGSAVTFTDPQQAGEHLAALMATGSRRLLILDDVWHAEQLAGFPVGGRCARLVTTRISSMLAGKAVPVRVDEVSPEQARALLTVGLPPLSAGVLDELVIVTWRWALLLRLVNKVLTEQAKTDPDVTRVARQLVERLQGSGALHIDQLTGAAEHLIDVDDPQQRQRAVMPTIEASTGLLSPQERSRFAELAIFAEDETVPVPLVGLLWQATGGLDLMATRGLCARLGDLALLTVAGTAEGGVVGLHDVVRDFLRGELDTARLNELHKILLQVVADSLPPAVILVPDDGSDLPCATTAWWTLDQSAHYLWDHLVEHLLAAKRIDDAEALASDLRWVAHRLERSGPAAPYADLALVGTPQCARLQRLLGQIGHLLAPTEPAHSRIDILCSRVDHDPYWGPQAAVLSTTNVRSRLTNGWRLPNLPHPSLLRTISTSAHTVVAPNGAWIASSGNDGTVQIWDVTTGTQRAELSGHTNSVLAVAPDGTWIASTGNDGTVRFWDVTSGTQRSKLPVHIDLLRAVAVAPDGTWIALIDQDRMVRIWDVTTGTQRAALSGHTSSVLAVAPNGDWIASAGDSGIVRIWDVTTGKPRVELFDRTGSVRALAVAPDNSWIASAGDSGIVRIWDVTTGKPRVGLVGHTGSVRALVVAPDNSWIASAGDSGIVQIWDVTTGKPRVELFGHTGSVRALAVAPDGTLITSVSEDQTVRIWNPIGAVRSIDSANARKDHQKLGHRPRAVAVAPNGTWIASAGDDRVVRIWDAATGNPWGELFGHGGSVRALAIAPDGTWIASAGDDRIVRIWNVATWTRRSNLSGHGGSVRALAIAPDGTWITSIGEDRTVRIWNPLGVVRSIDSANTHKEHLKLSHRPRAVAVAPNGAWIASAGDDGTVRIWNVATGRQVAMMRVEQVTSCVWALDSRSIVVSGSAGLYMFDFHPDSTCTQNQWSVSEG